MNFEEALKKVKAGTASDEEREYVRSRLSAANKTVYGAPAVDFDKALEHMEQGTATEEEISYVKARMEEADIALSDDAAQAGLTSAPSNDVRMPAAPVQEASKDDVKQAKKSFKKRYILVPVCVLLVIVVALGAILGGVFGYAASSAKKSMNFDLEHCKQQAIAYVLDNQQSLGVPQDVSFGNGQLRVEDVDRQFHYNAKKLDASYYYYEIDVEGRAVISGGIRPYTVELEVELRVNTVTGSVEVIKSDYDVD